MIVSRYFMSDYNELNRKLEAQQDKYAEAYGLRKDPAKANAYRQNKQDRRIGTQ